MNLHTRMGLIAGMAVAIAVIAVSISAYTGTRSQLRDQLDDSLEGLSQPFLARAGVDRAPAPPGGGRISATELGIASGQQGAADQFFSPTSHTDCDAGLGLDTEQSPTGFGEAQGYREIIRRNGRVCLANGETMALPKLSQVEQLAQTGTGSVFTDVRAHGTDLRVLATGLRWRGALLVALPLTEVNESLRSELVLLILTAAGGIALAALLGLFVARTALSPIARFTRQAEKIADRPDRIEHERLEVHGDDELGRLGRTFNATLDALEASMVAQRNLVADASHELRTPVASIRANLQLMRDEQMLSPEDRAALRADVIAELDELTALVSDVVELARGSKSATEPGDLRLDEVITHCLRRARRRAPELAFESTLEPTLVRGDGERVDRAITNLLDNAIKWSPSGEVIEVTLRGGVVTVRDHGPGFNPDDLPFVFDRFHRASAARSKPGSGLGLAIVRQAAEAHGGFASASNALGGGALLRVSFGTCLPVEGSTEPAAVRAST